LLEGEDCLYLIDQHAAHERLIYQSMMEDYKNQSISTQTLIDCQVLQLLPEDYQNLMEILDYFAGLGFEIEAFGQNTIIVRSVPLILGKPSSLAFIVEILDEIRKGKPEERSIMEAIIKKSCRQAIKASDRLDISEIKSLLSELSAMKGTLTCPHGRPIVLTLSRSDIEKYFKRV
jgi:DNA mismatch repair protein MutL